MENKIYGNGYVFNQGSNVFDQIREEALNEAVLLFTGKLEFDSKAGLPSDCLSRMDELFEKPDFICAPFEAELRTGLFRQRKANLELVRHMAPAFRAGYSMLYTCGSTGFSRKEQEAADGFILDEQYHDCIVNINSIRVAFVVNTGISKEYTDQLRQKGAEFIVVFTERFKDKNKENALQLAEAGADLVVMTYDDVRKNHHVTTEDGRTVPYIGGLGRMLTKEGGAESAAVRIRLIKSFSGEISLEAQYVPVQQRENFKGLKTAAVPAHKAYNHKFMDKRMRGAVKRVREKIGTGIRMDDTEARIRNRSGFKPQVSIREICEIIGVDVSEYDGTYPVDEKVHSVVIRKTELDEGCVAVIQNGAYESKKSITAEQAIEAQAILAIAAERVAGLPCLVVENPAEAFIKIATHIREQYNPLTIAITGTIGKSTTTDMIKTVMKYGYRTLDVRGNYNTYPCIGFCVQKLDDSYKAYVQEVHGGSTGAASLNSKIVQPDMCVVTYIGVAHLSQIKGGTVNDVLREKLSIIDGMKEGGTLFINNDNEYLQKVSPDVYTVRYAANNRDSDYYAENIVDFGDHITFTIVCEEGRYDALINCGGTYNVANAVCAFAVGRKAGIAPERILAGLSRFRTEGYRQNVVRKNGCIMTFDCDSTTPDSMLSALKSFIQTKTGDNGRYIAVLGDTAMLGKERERWHREYGQWIGKLGYDALITLGPRSLFTCEEAAKAGIETYGFTDRGELEKKIKDFIRPGDHVLFKSSPKGGSDLIPTIEALFGKYTN